MKDKISEDLKVEVLKQFLLNDNSLFQLRRENQADPYNLIGVVRYIDEDIFGHNLIREDMIYRVTEDDFFDIAMNEEFIEIRDINSRQLVEKYDLNNHEFVNIQKVKSMRK